MSGAKKEILTKVCIALILLAMVALCLANPNKNAGVDCITTGQVVIIEDEKPPLAAKISKTTTKTSVKKYTKKKKLKKKAKKSKTTTKKKTKRSTSTKKSGDKTIKTETTVVTTTKTITKKKSKIQRINTTVKTTVKTTTTTPANSAAAPKSGTVDVRTLAPKIKKGILDAFVDGGYKVVINPKVSYSGVFRSASKEIELKSANSVIYHEMGHFVSFKTGRADSTSEFKTIYKEEKDKYTASDKAYVTQSSGEYFAQSFKNYTENPTKLKKERPKTYAYVKDKVDQF